MRYGTRPALGIMLAMVLTTNSFGEETKARWWHFGRDKDIPSAPLAGTPAPTLSPAQTLTPATPVVTPVEEESWLHWPSMPKMSWLEPKTDADVVATDAAASAIPVTTESPTQRRTVQTHYGNAASRPRPKNTWMQQPASAETPSATETSTWQSMKSGTRNAWHKTVDFVTPGDETAEAPVIVAESKPSWWDRMWTTEEEEGPQTVTEWMAQDRLDP